MFPGSRLDLQIFEQRYLDMISRWCAAGPGLASVCCARETRSSVKRGARPFTVPDLLLGDRLGSAGQWAARHHRERLAKFRITDCWQGDSGVLEATVTFSEQDRLGEGPFRWMMRMPHWWVCFRVWRSIRWLNKTADDRLRQSLGPGLAPWRVYPDGD